VNRETNILSAKMAVKLKVDCLMGCLPECIEPTMKILEGTGIEFFPYIGKIVGHACQLRGSIEEITKQGKQAEKKGVDGVDLLAYRYDGNVDHLMSAAISSLRVPVIEPSAAVPTKQGDDNSLFSAFSRPAGCFVIVL